MPSAVCVYCSSSDEVAPVYVKAAAEMGEALAGAGLTLVYGGGSVGLMGIMARAVHARGGKVVGVIPQFMVEQELAYHHADELIVTTDMRERKKLMEQMACAFVALPGGFGTLEEVIEILSLRNLRQHDKPVVIVNTHGFYGPLLEQFQRFERERFVGARHLNNFFVVGDAAAAVKYLLKQCNLPGSP